MTQIPPRVKPVRQYRPLVGPLFAYDLVASTRRGQHVGLRVLIATLLLIVLYCVYSVELRVDPLANPFKAGPTIAINAMAGFANNFAIWCIVVQMLAVLLVTPIVVADAIAREKERRALDFLFVTDLTDREIVFGKLGSRLTYLVGVLLTGMPVVGMTQLFGGVSLGLFIGGYVVIYSTLIGLTSLSICCSVLSKTSLQATTRAYAVAAGYLLFSPCVIGMMRGDEGFIVAVTAFAFANLMVSVFAVGTSLTELRPRALALTYHLPPVPLTMPSVPAVAKTAVKTAAQPMRGWGAMEDDGGPPFVRPAPPLTPKLPRHVEVWQPPPIPPPPLPPIDEERPLLWKEVCLHSFTRGRVGPATPALMGAIVVAAVLLGLMLIVVLTDRNAGLHEIAQLGTIVVKVVTVAVGSILGLAAILHTTNSIVRERERDTLDALLTLPFDRVMLLEAKWLGGLYDLRALPMILGLGWLFGLVTGGLHPIALFWLICCVLAPIEFLASLGLWLSAVNRSSLRANLVAALCVLGVGFGPWIAANYVEFLYPRGYGQSDWSDIVYTTLMPPAAWLHAAVSWEDYAKLPAYTGDVLLSGALLYAIGAWLLWRMSVARLRWVAGKR